MAEDETNEPYLICALPRSRTSWLSILLSHGPSICYHELIGDCQTPDDFKHRVKETDALFVGNSDSSNAWFYDKICATLGHIPTTVIIRRPIADVVDSWQRVAGSSSPVDWLMMKSLARELERAKEKAGAQALEVDYNELEDMDTLRKIWKFCTSDYCAFDEERALRIQRLNIQPRPDKFNEEIQRVMPNAESWTMTV